VENEGILKDGDEDDDDDDEDEDYEPNNGSQYGTCP
jgi:hypothetical protein